MTGWGGAALPMVAARSVAAPVPDGSDGCGAFDGAPVPDGSDGMEGATALRKVHAEIE